MQSANIFDVTKQFKIGIYVVNQANALSNKLVVDKISENKLKYLILNPKYVISIYS